MIDCEYFYQQLVKNEIDFFCGVPDSLLKDFCACISEKKDNYITANEGNAIALATGHYLSTKKIGLVYMQNSGLGNSINPLVSLTDPDVYGIPILLLIGWRGEPGKKDEPQHVKQGKITLQLLQDLGIPFEILPVEHNEVDKCIGRAIEEMHKYGCTYALVVRKGTFSTYNSKPGVDSSYELTREDALRSVMDFLGPKDLIVSTTGKLSRELYEIRDSRNQGHANDFLTVGSMGHSSSIALGIAFEKPSHQVYCFDGDGALIMHMGALAIAGSNSPKNFKHIIFNNGAHDSVGGQPTAGFKIDVVGIAKACGYKVALRAERHEDLARNINLLKNSEGPSLLEIRIRKGSRKDLGRPLSSPKENKTLFMDHLMK